MTHRERKSLTSYVGMNRIAHIDRNLTPIQLCHGDKLLLVSDGVFGTLETGEMEEALRKNQMPKAAAEQIIEMVKAHQKPKQDNASAVVLFCE